MTQRRSLNLKLVLSVMVAFLLSMTFTWFLHSRLSERDAYKLIDRTFESVEDEITDCVNERLVRQCMAVRERLEEGHPTDTKSLQALAREMHVTEISIANSKGDITHASVRARALAGMSHIPEDRHKHGLILDYTLEQNMVLQRYYEPTFQNHGFIRFDEMRKYSEDLIERYDVRSSQGPVTVVRSMSGGNQQKAIVAREIDRDMPLIVAVQPTRGLDVGAIENIHRQLVAQRDAGKAVLLVSLELDEVMNLSDRILVMYEGEIVGEFDPHAVTVEELGLYMAGARRQAKEEMA